MLDMKDFADTRYTQMMVGCPATRKIYLLKKSVVVKHPKIAKGIETLYQRAMKLLVNNFHNFYNISEQGELIITEEGMAVDYEYVAKLKELLTPVLTIIRW